MDAKCRELWQAELLRVDGITASAIRTAPHIDIGCGDGSGIIALSKSLESVSILSLDDNSQCLHLAQSQCKSNGLSTELIERLVASARTKTHQLAIVPGNLRFTTQITLLEGDVLWDEELVAFIESAKFNAITVWLLGAYDSKEVNAQTSLISEHSLRLLGDYRRITHQRIYQIAERILKPGGIITFRGAWHFN